MQSQNRSRCRESVLGVKSIRAFWIKIPTIPQTSQPRKQLAEDSSKGKAEDELKTVKFLSEKVTEIKEMVEQDQIQKNK